MRVEVNKYGKIDVFTDINDLCYSCENNTDCPLVEALRADIVFLHYEEIDIKKCGLYRKKGSTNE
jgi:hypothetical protein